MSFDVVLPVNNPKSSKFTSILVQIPMLRIKQTDGGMTIKLDQLDKEIIDLLSRDGRMSCADIAREIGSISERSVRYRLEKLINENVIHVTARPVPQSLGYSIVADVFIEADSGQVLDVARKIASFENVAYVAGSTGESDITVRVISRSNRELYDFVTEVLGKIPGVRKTTTSLVPFIIKNVDEWRIPSSVYKEFSKGKEEV